MPSPHAELPEPRRRPNKLPSLDPVCVGHGLTSARAKPATRGAHAGLEHAKAVNSLSQGVHRGCARSADDQLRIGRRTSRASSTHKNQFSRDNNNKNCVVRAPPYLGALGRGALSFCFRSGSGLNYPPTWTDVPPRATFTVSQSAPRAVIP